MWELLTFIPFFCGLSAIAVVILLAITSAILLAKQARAKQKAAWNQLAIDLNLSLSSEGTFFSSGDSIIGNYRGYSLKLVTIAPSEGSHARIAIAVPKTDKQQPKSLLSFQEALNRLNLPSLQYKLGVTIKAAPRGQIIYYDQPGTFSTIEDLGHLFDLLIGLVEAYPILINLGGEAIPILQAATKNQALQPIITTLLEDIAQNTSERFAQLGYLLCPNCLTRFGPHRINLSWEHSCTYYGCRTCGQSREFLEGPVIVVLDNQMTAGPTRQEGFVRINWSARRELFDFDAIEIVHATDEEVERFAVQVGNDTDPTRESRYRNMQCVILPGCQLSENTIRILQRTFKVVIANEAAHWTEKESGMNSELLRK